MGKKGWTFIGVIACALIAVLVWAFSTPKDRESLALRDQEEKIRDLENQVTRLQSELKESSKQIESLQAGSHENRRTRRSAEQRVDNSARGESHTPAQISSSSEPSFYQAVRSTAVFEEPSASSRTVATIQKGTRVRVVGSKGDWLEVRSRQGRPPGFIRRDDAVLTR